MHNESKHFSEVVNELKYEAKEFVSTRFEILRQEMKTKLSAWKTAIPLLLLAAICGLAAFIILNAALVAFLAGWFAPSPYNWCYAALIVGFFYVLAGGALYFIGMREFKAEGFVPVRTMRVLKQDQVWLQNEARSQL
ncbi:MAG TPA: phage holin family protein [Terriglobales bacterium]